MSFSESRKTYLSRLGNMGLMNRFLSLLVILSIFTLTPALAQFGSFVSIRAVSGLGLAAGYGTIGAELEWLDPFTVVYPRGSVAYMVGGGVWLGGSVTGGSLQAGAALYAGPDRDGFFGAARGGGAIVADNATRVGTLFGTLSLTGGYRFVTGPLELGLEGGLFFASTDINANQSLLYITPTLALSAGFRF